jgi:uncharacterized membrane protein YbhN (UPF0104 family)
MMKYRIAAIIEKGKTIYKENIQKRGVRIGIYALILILSVFFVVFVAYRNWNQLSAQKWNFNLWYLGLSFFLSALGWIPSITAWHYLLKGIGVHLPYRTNLRYYCLSAIPRHVPGLVLYFTSRTILYQDDGISPKTTIVATIIETLMLSMTGFIISLIIFLFHIELLQQYSIVLIAAIISIIIILGIQFLSPLLKKLVILIIRKKEIEPPQLDRKLLFATLVWMAVAWIGGGIDLFLFTRSMIYVDWTLLPLFVGIWCAAGAISMTIGIIVTGFGIREITMTGLLSLYIPPLAALSVSIGFRLAIMTVAELLWTLLLLWLAKMLPSSRKVKFLQ